MTPGAVHLMAEKAAVRILQEENPETAVETFFRLQDKLLHATMLVLGSLPGGAKCISALLTVMSPVQACRCAGLREHTNVCILRIAMLYYEISGLTASL